MFNLMECFVQRVNLNYPMLPMFVESLNFHQLWLRVQLLIQKLCGKLNNKSVKIIYFDRFFYLIIKIIISQCSQALTKENRLTYAKLNNVKRILHLKENY